MVADDSRLLLAIDTSTETTGLCLYDGESISEVTWRAGRNQTTHLLSQIHHLLEVNKKSLGDICAVGVATGPGTFNGLRVGLSTAKGLSYSLGVPIVGVDTLEAAAYPFRDTGKPVRAYVPAGRGRTVFCDFRNRNGRWVRMGEMQNRQFEELTLGLTEPTLLVGEGNGESRASDQGSQYAHYPSPALAARRPSCVAEIAHRRWTASDVDEIATLEPVYVHGNRAGATRG